MDADHVREPLGLIDEFRFNIDGSMSKPVCELLRTCAARVDVDIDDKEIELAARI